VHRRPCEQIWVTRLDLTAPKVGVASSELQENSTDALRIGIPYRWSLYPEAEIPLYRTCQARALMQYSLDLCPAQLHRIHRTRRSTLNNAGKVLLVAGKLVVAGIAGADDF
jgi:hypothetical protein